MTTSGETPETAEKTIQLAKQLKIDTAQFSGLVAYPGTEFYRWAKENDYLIPRRWRDWVDEDFEQCATVDLPDLSLHEINAQIGSVAIGGRLVVRCCYEAGLRIQHVGQLLDAVGLRQP